MPDFPIFSPTWLAVSPSRYLSALILLSTYLHLLLPTLVGAVNQYTTFVGRCKKNFGLKYTYVGSGKGIQHEVRKPDFRHLGTDEYEEEFGTPDEGETAVLSLTVPAATYRAIKSEAARRGCSMRDMAVEWAATLARD